MYRYKILLLISLLIILIESTGCPQSTGKNGESKSPSSQSAKTSEKTPENSSGITPERIAELEKRFSENPSSYIMASDLANAYAKSNQPDKAIGVLDAFMKNAIGPDVERAKIDRAVLMTQYGRAEEGYAELLKIAETKDNKLRGEAYFQLGNLIATGKYSPPNADKVELAVKYLESALDYGQVDPLIYRRLADLMYSEGKLDMAREYLAIYLAVYPFDGDSWIDLGNWSVEAKDTKRAREYFKRALESDREDVRKKAEDALKRLPSGE